MVIFYHNWLLYRLSRFWGKLLFILNFSKVDDVEEQGLNGTANNVNNSQEAILIIRHYEDVIRTQNKEAIGCIGKQGQFIRKFKDSEHFFGNVHQGRSTYFEILLHRFLKK